MITQDGPSLESSSYLNKTLRYLGPWDPGTIGPSDPWTFGLLDFHFFDLFPSPLPPHTSYLSPSSWFGLVWVGMGGGVR